MSDTNHRPIGERHGRAHLTDEAVLAIRAAKGRFTQKELAEQFGVDRSHMMSRQVWRHI